MKMKREAKIGIFAVAMMLLAWGGIRFMSGLDVFSRNVEYLAAYDQVSGVQEASAVMMKGVKIGSVARIELNPTVSDKVILHLIVRRSYRIPSDSEARIFSDGFLGGKAIEIVYGSSHDYLVEGDTIRSSRDRDLMDVAGSELDFFKQKFSLIAEELNRTLLNLNTLMERNSANLTATMDHIETITGDMADLMASEKQTIASAVEHLAAFSTMLGESAPRIDSLITGANGIITALDEEAFAEKLTATIDELNGLIGKIDAGEGSLGQLINDRAMYDNLTAASENLSLLLADLKANPARYVHLSVFGKDADKAQQKADKKAAKEAKKAAKKADKEE